MTDKNLIKNIERLKNLTQDMGVWFDLEAYQKKEITDLLETYEDYEKAKNENIKNSYMKKLKNLHRNMFFYA